MTKTNITNQHLKLAIKHYALSLGQLWSNGSGYLRTVISHAFFPLVVLLGSSCATVPTEQNLSSEKNTIREMVQQEKGYQLVEEPYSHIDVTKPFWVNTLHQAITREEYNEAVAYHQQKQKENIGDISRIIEGTFNDRHRSLSNENSIAKASVEDIDASHSLFSANYLPNSNKLSVLEKESILSISQQYSTVAVREFALPGENNINRLHKVVSLLERNGTVVKVLPTVYVSQLSSVRWYNQRAVVIYKI